jgi:hypothetical protein
MGTPLSETRGGGVPIFQLDDIIMTDDYKLMIKLVRLIS